MGESKANGWPAPRASDFLLKRVRLQGYKSISECDVELGPLTMLVGRNGSGKSNFLDALRFIADGLRASLDHAVRDRGGMAAILRLKTGPLTTHHSPNFTIQVEMDLPTGRQATYGFAIAGIRHLVAWEELKIVDSRSSEIAHYRTENGRIVSSSTELMPPVAPDRLYLVHAAARPEIREVYDVLMAMGFYNLNPEAMKRPQLHGLDAGTILLDDGSNVASVLARIEEEEPETKQRIRSYLTTIVPEIVDVDREMLGPMETLVFRQGSEEANKPRKFYANSMSDGTLRALGTLVAVNQLADGSSPVRLVGIEEPETALHPAASGALMDALREVATHTQVLVTTHSPDLLDQIDPERDHLLVVQASRGETRIGLVNAASRQAIKDHLYTAGELLRMDQLEPDQRDLHRQDQLRMFEGVGDAE